MNSAIFHPQLCLLGKADKQAKAAPLMRFSSPAPPFCSEELKGLGLGAAPRNVSLVSLKPPWAAFHPLILQFVMQEQSGLPDLIQASSPQQGSPWQCPLETQPAHRTFWNSSWKSCPGAGAKVGKLPQLTGYSTEHPSPAAGQCMAAPKAPLQADL